MQLKCAFDKINKSIRARLDNVAQFVFNNSQLSMEQFFNKIYKLEKSENFNEFLKEMGMLMILSW